MVTYALEAGGAELLIRRPRTEAVCIDIQREFGAELRSLLIGEDFTYDVHSFEKLDCNGWQENDYKDYAKWLHDLINSPVDAEELETAGPGAPTEAIYERAYFLGVGPELRRITRRFGPLWKFHDIMGFEGGYCRGKYGNWTIKDFISYGKNLVAELGGKKPTTEILQTKFEARQGPSPAIIFRRVGGVGKFQEMLGFPFVHDWSNEEFVAHGVRVAEANPGIELTREVFDQLSKRKKGPATRTIVNRFGSLGAYQNLVARAHEDKTLHDQKLREMLDSKPIPDSLIEDASNLSEAERLAHRGAYTLVAVLLREYPVKEQVRVAQVNPANLVTSIRNRNPALGAGFIEATALELGVYDFIWPMDDYKEQLRFVHPKVLKGLLRPLSSFVSA